MTLPISSLLLEAELLTLDFQSMYVRWGKTTPPRTGMHASAILDKQFCVREQVLHELYPEQGEGQEWNHWDWKKSAIFENGWRLHQRWQDVFRKCGNVVYSPVSVADAWGVPESHVTTIDGQICAAELDLTHYDAERNLYFSPDAIIQFGGVKYVVEIKGINNEAFYGTPRDEQGQLLKGLRNSQGKEIKPQEGLSDDLEASCAANETVHKAREQVNFYMHLLGLERGIILVENKSNQDFRLWVVEADFQRYEPYRDRLYAVKRDVALAKRHGVNSAFPVRACQSINETRAKQCPMRKLCFAQQESEEW